MFNAVTERDIQHLKSITSADRVLTGNAISVDYGHDELALANHMPEVLIKVETTEEIAAVLKYANEHAIPVVVRGSGTGLVGAGVALHGGIMLETLKMNQIIELDRENLAVTVQPGVLLMELATYCEENGFLYPPDPGEKSATIGGNISTNAGGMRAVKYGVTRDYVRGVTAVTPTGEILQLGGKVVKNSTGYALKELLIGSEGTLAVITEAILKLVPLPEITVSLLVPFADIRTAIETVPLLVQSKCALTAMEFMESDTIKYAEEYLGKRFPDSKAPAYLLLTVDGSSSEQVDAVLDDVSELCLQNGALDAYIVDTEERKASVWTARGAFLEAIKASTTEMDECDVVVPRSVLADFVLYTHEVAKQLGIRIQSFGHAGDGNLHVYICRDQLNEKEWDVTLEEAFRLLYRRANELGGKVSGEHGIGYAKRGYMAEACSSAELALMRGMKRVFDPKGILNPGKVI